MYDVIEGMNYESWWVIYTKNQKKTMKMQETLSKTKCNQFWSVTPCSKDSISGHYTGKTPVLDIKYKKSKFIHNCC